MTRLVKAYREFLYVEDMAEAEACCYLMQYYEDESIINIGTGQDVRQSKTSLRDGIEMTYDGYLNNLSTDVDTNETE